MIFIPEADSATSDLASSSPTDLSETTRFLRVSIKIYQEKELLECLGINRITKKLFELNHFIKMRLKTVYFVCSKTSLRISFLQIFYLALKAFGDERRVTELGAIQIIRDTLGGRGGGVSKNVTRQF